jgi:hypothetical protein
VTFTIDCKCELSQMKIPLSLILLTHLGGFVLSCTGTKAACSSRVVHEQKQYTIAVLTYQDRV